MVVGLKPMSHNSWVFAENVHAVVQELEVSWARAGGIKLRAAERDVLLLRLQWEGVTLG